MNDTDINKLIERSRSVCVFTGAGISAESGIPTFRDSGGLWENYRPEDLVTPEAFEKDPVTVWRWHMWLRSLSMNASPNEAHLWVAEIEKKVPNFLLITQNIDDLHERAGNKNIAKIHGNIMEMLCLENGHLTRISDDVDYRNITDIETLPKCPICGGKARPNVVWFGELLPVEELYKAYDFLPTCDLFIIIGTSGIVSGGYGFTEMAKGAGAFVLEINPDESALSYLADYVIRDTAVSGVRRIKGVRG